GKGEHIIDLFRVEAGEAEIKLLRVELLQFEREQFLIPFHWTDRLTMMRNAFTWAGVHSSQRITGTSAMFSLRAAFSRRCPSTTSPSLRANTGILKPNSRMEEHMRSTAESFLRGLRA